MTSYIDTVVIDQLEQTIKKIAKDSHNTDGTITCLDSREMAEKLKPFLKSSLEHFAQMDKKTTKQAWSGLVWLRDILKSQGVEKPTVRGRDIQEIIDEIRALLAPTKGS